MLDKIFATIGMLGVIAFMGVVTVFIMEPDLWIVTIVVIGIGIVFLVRDLKDIDSQPEGNSRTDTESRSPSGSAKK